jgi:hypothetical protein
MYNDLRIIYNSTDYNFIKDKIADLDGLRTYRDPIVEISNGLEYDATKRTEVIAFDAAIDECDDDFPDFDGYIIPYASGTYDGITFNTTTADILKGTLNTANTEIGNRITEINTRIGMPTYGYANGTTIDTSTTGVQASNGANTQIIVLTVPSKSSDSLIPYGRTIYESVNICLGDDVGLLIKVSDEAESLDSSYKSIRDDRNEYDMLKGRSKYYGY